MRLAAQTKMGFYPAHPDAISAICEHLEPDPKRADEMAILDPCCGEGLAIKQIATHLGVLPERTYAIELDAGRAAVARNNLPGSKVLGPASFFGSRINASAFGLIYCNPPFDDELGGGGRQEHTFTRRVTWMLRPGGILVLVLPYRAMSGSGGDFRAFLDANYEDAEVFEFPEHRRPFKELVYIGSRRVREVPKHEIRNHLSTMEWWRTSVPLRFPSHRPTARWVIPWSRGSSTFLKTEMTEAERFDAINGSPLNKLLKTPAVVEFGRPPCDLSTGHVSLLLASGLLNGVIEPEGEDPHVVRGTARKIDFKLSETMTVNEETEVTTNKQVFSQKIVLTVRAVGPDGVIHTYEDGDAAIEEEQADGSDD